MSGWDVSSETVKHFGYDDDVKFFSILDDRKERGTRAKEQTSAAALLWRLFVCTTGETHQVRFYAWNASSQLRYVPLLFAQRKKLLFFKSLSAVLLLAS
mmetsp:Transcript_40569/g.60137  ORF Transcript_40569/g.60137 Transcript_40569/m.60137 type:complete len:99 (-) Transcript_40569:1293-1589(-)